jgi:regulator of sigma E protease
MLTLIAFLAVLSILVLVHEFGHFYSARKFGCKVEEFGFGFPPRVFGFRRKRDGHDGTLYSVNWIPLGGFVKIKGEGGEAAEEADSFAHKKAWQRAIILSAGVGMNVLLAVFLLSVGYVFGVPQAIEDLPSFAKVRDRRIQVMNVQKDSPAEKAGIETTDTLLGYLPVESSDEIPSLESISSFSGTKAIQDYFNENTGNEVIVVVKKADGQEMPVNLTPEELAGLGRGGIGVALVETGIVSYPWYIAPYKGLMATVSLTKQIVVAFAYLLRDLVIEQRLSMDVTGPIGIAVLTGSVVRQGISQLIYFVALLSINLAIINFLPFPALDGGRFLFLAIEKIRRKPVDHKVENIIHTLGFVLLLFLVLVVTVRDVRQFSDAFLNAIDKLKG